MGLFSRKKQTKKEAAPPPEKEPESLAELSGMQVEVLDAEGQLLFDARLSIAESGRTRLVQTSPASVPPFEPPLPVKLRGYRETEHSAVHLEGGITREDENLWAVEGLKLTGRENDRAFFRQDTTIAGELRPIGFVGAETKPCEIINISAGGARIRASEEYRAGDKLLLIAPLRRGAEPSTLLCEIRRGAARRGGTFEYGCRFVNLTETAEDQIAEAIMELQRQRLKR